MDREGSGGGIEGGSSSVGEHEMTTLAADLSRPSAPIIRRAQGGVAAGLCGR